MNHNLIFLLSELIIKWAFKIYTNKEFLTIIKFSQLRLIDRHRILNELLFAGQILAAGILKFHGKHNLEEKVIDEHTNLLKELGVERKNRMLWKRISKIRIKEYEDNKNSARMAMIQFEGEERGVDSSKMDEINFMIPQFTTATLCHKYIALKKLESQDYLFQFIMKGLSELAQDIHILVSEEY